MSTYWITPCLIMLYLHRMNAKDFYKNFGKRLKELRINAGLSQEQLAEKVGVSTKTVSYWENSHNPVTFGKIPLIAETLNIPVYKLFLFFDDEETAADKDYVALLRARTGKELDTLFKIVKELQKI